jgi:hypothetical protein
MYQVIDRHGRTLTLEDDVPCPDGCRLALPLTFMDAEQRAVADATKDADDHDDGDPEAIRERAYLARKAALDTANTWQAPHKARRFPVQPEPSWQRLPGTPRKGKGVEVGGAAPSGDGASAVNDAARRAYAERSKRMSQAYKKRPYAAGPWGDQRPQWQRNAGMWRPPAIGPSGRAPASSTHMDARETAWRAMCDRLSTAYLRNRKQFVPGD